MLVNAADDLRAFVAFLFNAADVLRVFVEIGVMRGAYPRHENVASNKKVLIINTKSWSSSGL